MKILADTNIWCDFFRQGDMRLAELLGKGYVCMHPLVIGELAMGNLPNRARTIQDLDSLAKIPMSSWQETMTLLETQKLYGLGLQWNDLQILSSVILSPQTVLWTRDGRLDKIAKGLNLGFS